MEKLTSRGVRQRHANERLTGNSRDPHASDEVSIALSVTLDIRDIRNSSECACRESDGFIVLFVFTGQHNL